MHKTGISGVLKKSLCTPKTVLDLYKDLAVHLDWFYEKDKSFIFFYRTRNGELAGFLKEGEDELFIFQEMLTTLDQQFLEKMYT